MSEDDRRGPNAPFGIAKELGVERSLGEVVIGLIPRNRDGTLRRNNFPR